MVPSSFGAQSAAPCAISPATSFVVLLPAFLRAWGKVARWRPVSHRGAGNDSGGAHHIEHARDEAEQKKKNEPPGRDTEQPVDQPADPGSDQHASNEFAREPEAPGVARCSRRPISTRTFGRRSHALARGAQAFAETLESRGEGGFVGVCLVAVAVS